MRESLVTKLRVIKRNVTAASDSSLAAMILLLLSTFSPVQSLAQFNHPVDVKESEKE